ncbi:MAG: hypothetical protein UY07_C0006G0047 [Parcubacteria group bacterium GW2011_GWA1_47_8]|nr:MAG: hypothetical protein UY07_C0006G0047 [Parcubacteria group bacterium GW2011_GWA1_47_8]
MKQNTHDFRDQANDALLSPEEIGTLKKESTQRSGCWEIDWGPEPFSQAMGGGESRLTLTMVVHQESYFIIDTLVSPSDETEKGVSAFASAIKKQFRLPETIVVRDKVLRDELELLATALGCDIVVSRLKAIPQIRRDMKRFVG